MTVTEQRHIRGQRNDDIPTRPLPALRPGAASDTVERKPTVLDQMGGPMGFVYSTIPVVVFVTANAFLPLPMTIPGSRWAPR